MQPGDSRSSTRTPDRTTWLVRSQTTCQQRSAVARHGPRRCAKSCSTSPPRSSSGARGPPAGRRAVQSSRRSRSGPVNRRTCGEGRPDSRKVREPCRRTADGPGGGMPRPPSGWRRFLAPQRLHSTAVRVRGRPRDGRSVRILQVAARRMTRGRVHRVGADGQVYGGVVMGIGKALSRRTQFDDQGRQRNPHLLDYKLRTLMTVPRSNVDWIENPAENGGRVVPEVSATASVPTAGAIGKRESRTLIGARGPRAPR